ncbi:MAG: hypothetical protein LBM08_07735 [Dysgonamonadaceae bacterium]|nr:hypothetical protein [Dysgonamonadaceae bacterium]
MKKKTLLFFCMMACLTAISAVTPIEAGSIKNNTLQAAASTTESIADGLITVSDDNTDIWYYIEVPYSSQVTPIGSIINDHSGRGFTVLTSKGASTNAQFNPLLPNSLRKVQQWKVVANGSDKYSLVNGEGKYFGNLREVSTLEEALQFTVTKMNNYFVKLLNSSNIALGAHPNYTEARFDGNPTNTNLNQNTGLPADGNPGLRTLRFVPIAEIDDNYPVIEAQNSVPVDWFFITSTDPDKTATPCLTLKADGTTFELAAQATGSDDLKRQLFGFVSNDNGEKTNIICLADPTKSMDVSSNSLTLSAMGTKSWILRHVIAPANSNKIQGVIRDSRGTASGTTSGGVIITNELKTENWNYNFTTYDNKYTWFYEPAPTYDVTLTESDENISIVNPSVNAGETATCPVKYGHSLTFSYAVNDSYAPEVTVNGTLYLTGVAEAGSGFTKYTLTVSNITENTAIVLSAVPAIAVTVTADEHISIISPTLDINDQYLSISSSFIQLEMDEGYTPRITSVVNADTVAPAITSLGSNLYNILLTQITDDAIIAIAADPIVLDVEVTAGIGISLQEAPINAKYFTDYSLSFVFTEGYHHPYVKVNGTLWPVVENDGVCTITLPDVRENKSIRVEAFAPSLLPVTEDTYVRGGNTITIYGTENQHTNYSQEGVLMVRHSSADIYELRSYLRFDPTAEIRATPYNQVLLRLVMAANPDRTSGNQYYQIKTAPATLDAINTMTWVSNGETRAELKGDSISEYIRAGFVSEGFVPGKVMETDVTEYILENLAEDSIRIQLAGVLTSSDMLIQFYARESGNIDYVPVLVFNALPSSVDLTADNNIILVLPTESGSTQVDCGASYTVQFKVLAGYSAQVTVDEQIVDAGNPDENGIYTVTINNIKANIAVEIAAIPGTSTDWIISNDPVIEVHYYNLLGQEIYEPNTTDIYITKKIYASKRVEISKNR